MLLKRHPLCAGFVSSHCVIGPHSLPLPTSQRRKGQREKTRAIWNDCLQIFSLLKDGAREKKRNPVILSHFQLVPADLELWLHKPDRHLKCNFSCGRFSRDALSSKSHLRLHFTSLWEKQFSHDGSKIPPNLLHFSTDGADKATWTLTLIIIFFPFLLFLVLLMHLILSALQSQSKIRHWYWGAQCFTFKATQIWVICENHHLETDLIWVWVLWVHICKNVNDSFHECWRD